MLNLKRIDTAPQTQRSISDFNVKTHTSQFPNRNALPHNKNSVSGGDEVATMASHFSSKKPATQLSKPDIVVEKETEKSFSSLADLEKVIHYYNYSMLITHKYTGATSYHYIAYVLI